MNKSLLNIKQNRNKILSKTKSFSRSFKGIKLYNFSQIESYGKIRRPLLTQTKKQYLKTRLDIENTAEERMRQRSRLNDLYVPFDWNPFSHSQDHSKSSVTIQTTRQNNHQKPVVSNKNIVVQMSKIKVKNKIDRKRQNYLLLKDQQNAQRISNQLRQKVKKSTIVDHRATQKSKNQKQAKNESSVVPFFQDHTMDFQEIITMTDHSYYWRKNQSINIFKELYDSDNLVSKSLLDKYYFSFSSMAEKHIKIKAPVERDLSRQARGQITKKPDIQLQNLDTFDKFNLNFTDILNVAAGRFTPEYVYQFTNPNKHKEQNSENDSEEIIYGDETENIGCTIDNEALQHKQVQQFFKLNLTPKQITYMNTCLNQRRYVQNHLKTEIQLLKRNVYDRKQHQTLRDNITEGLKRFIEFDCTYPTRNTDRDRMISQNKEIKNKTQNIKLDQFSETIVSRNQQNERIRQLIKKRL